MKPKGKSKFSLFCWNIGNPSEKRAKRQTAWLDRRPEDVFVLTETKNSHGCLFIKKYFQERNYDVFFSKPKNNEYGTMIISKYSLKASNFSNKISYLPPRVASVKLELSTGWLEIIGVYAPSRNSEPKKIIKKKRFLENLIGALKERSASSKTILCGDLNILEPNHIPHYPFFQKWEYDFYQNLTDNKLADAFRHLNPKAKEYSWIGRTGDGYRYDHCFASKDLLSSLHKSCYLSQPREMKLSDHSALVTTFNLNPLNLKPKTSPMLF